MSTEKMLNRYDELMDNKFTGWLTTAEERELLDLRAEILCFMGAVDNRETQIMENKAEMGMICGNRAEDVNDATYGSGATGSTSVNRDSFRDICDDAQRLHDGLMQDQKLGGAATLDELINVLKISGRLAGLLSATQREKSGR